MGLIDHSPRPRRRAWECAGPGPEEALAALRPALERLHHRDRETLIDLGGLTAAGRERLRQRLGVGEVRVSLHSELVRVELYETRLRGVWWARIGHPDLAEVHERLEITRCPAVLACGRDDLEHSLRQLDELGPSGPPADVLAASAALSVGTVTEPALGPLVSQAGGTD